MSDDEGYAPAAQMLICFIFPTRVQKNTDSDDRCQSLLGHKDYPGLRCDFTDLSCGCDSIQFRETDVEKNHVRL